METPIQALPLKQELEEVEQNLQRALTAEVRVVAELGDYLYRSGGKRFRPALAILFYKLLGEHGDHTKLIELATVLELIHMATLVHDDVIDESAERRGQPALWKAWGNRMAILQGDFIFSRVFKILNRQEDRIRFLITDTVEEILLGELLQEDLRWRVPTEREYFEVIRRKTASLIATSCAVGALLGDPGIDRGALEAVHEAGLRLGLAYQMVDDLLDIFGDDRLGKPTWRDRDEGWITLPFVWLLARLPGEQRVEVRRLLLKPELTTVEREQLRGLLVESGIREEFRARARAEVGAAKRLLERLPETELREAVIGALDFVVERDF